MTCNIPPVAPDHQITEQAGPPPHRPDQSQAKQYALSARGQSSLSPAHLAPQSAFHSVCPCTCVLVRLVYQTWLSLCCVSLPCSFLRRILPACLLVVLMCVKCAVCNRSRCESPSAPPGTRQRPVPGRGNEQNRRRMKRFARKHYSQASKCFLPKNGVIVTVD